MKKLLYLICIACTLALYSCGTTKAYVGARQEKASLATINQGNNKLTIKNRKTKESALLIQVDSISVGDYFKGYPKHCDILPGTHTVEIRHFQQWNDNQAGAAAVGGVLGGAIGGVIAGSIGPITLWRSPTQKLWMWISMSPMQPMKNASSPLIS